VNFDLSVYFNTKKDFTMIDSIDIPASPEGMMWCAVVHQAVRDLYAPNSNSYPKSFSRPFAHPAWKTAAEFIFSGEQDDHKAWELAGLDPADIRQEVISKMTTGETVGRVGSRESMFGPIDFRSMRATVLLALKQVADHYGTDGVSEMFADDARPAFRRMIGQFRQQRQWIEL
jgi:hypothetical protein